MRKRHALRSYGLWLLFSTKLRAPPVAASIFFSASPFAAPHESDEHVSCVSIRVLYLYACPVWPYVRVPLPSRTCSRGQGLEGPASGRTRWGAANVFRQRFTSYKPTRTTAAQVSRQRPTPHSLRQAVSRANKQSTSSRIANAQLRLITALSEVP